jgi:hypothetical protein
MVRLKRPADKRTKEKVCMKKVLVMLLGLSLTGLVALAADDEKKPDGTKPPERPVAPRLLQQYDKNHDGKLDESEKEAMRKDQEAKRKELIAKYDKNGDGKLDESEMAAARADRRKAAEEARKKVEPKPEEKK